MTARQVTPDILDNILTGSPAQPQATMLLLQRITNDGGTQMRAGMDPETIKEYQDAINESESWPFPPVVVYHDGDRYWLADGFHRVNAAHRSGKYLEVPADIRAGTRRDAVLHAAGANASHGLRRTNADKRRAVETLLRDEEWRQWSNYEIARRCSVAESSVRNIRAEMERTTQIAQSIARTGADGRTINTANIGASRPAPRVEMFEIEQAVRGVVAAQRVGASDLRLIARQRIGRVWQDVVAELPASTPYREISQGCNNVADQMEQAARREAAPAAAPAADVHQGAGRTPPPPLSVDDLVDELRPHTESATVAAIELAAHGAFNAVRQRCATVLSDFTYRVADVLDALQRIADERRAQDAAAPVVVNGDQPLPAWTQVDDEPARQQQLVEALFDLTRNEYAEWIQAAIDGKHPRIFMMCEKAARDYHGCNLKDALRQVVQRRHDAGQFGPVDTSATPPAPEPIIEEESSEPLPVSQRSDYESDEWYTPQEYIDAAKAVMGGIDLDPASSEMAQTVVRADSYLTRFDNGLGQTRWLHQRIWLNPPYSNPAPWVEKLVREHQAGPYCTEAIVLVNNATETSWFQMLLERFPVCLPARRIAFWRHDHANVGARQGQAFFYLGPNAAKFQEVFSQFGPILRRVS